MNKEEYERESIKRTLEDYRKHPKYNSKTEELFLDWRINQNKYFLSELDEMNVPENCIKLQLNSYEYERLTADLQKCYTKIGENEYSRNAHMMTDQDKREYVNRLIFKPKQVVWVDFGFNIGVEFGGKHPAIILKKVGEALIVVPLSSSKYDHTKHYEVSIPKIASLRHDMHANIQRIIQVSIHRVDLSSNTAFVNKTVFTRILDAIRNYWA